MAITLLTCVCHYFWQLPLLTVANFSIIKQSGEFTWFPLSYPCGFFFFFFLFRADILVLWLPAYLVQIENAISFYLLVRAHDKQGNTLRVPDESINEKRDLQTHIWKRIFMDTIDKAHIQSALIQLHYAFGNKTRDY